METARTGVEYARQRVTRAESRVKRNPDYARDLLREAQPRLNEVLDALAELDTLLTQTIKPKLERLESVRQRQASEGQMAGRVAHLEHQVQELRVALGRLTRQDEENKHVRFEP